MKWLEAVNWRWVLVLLVIASVALYGGYQMVSACPRDHASAPPDRLAVIRTISGDGRPNPPAPGYWVFGEHEAQEVLAAIDNLQAPTDTYFCPLGDGSVFDYTFTRGQHTVFYASAEGGGCPFLRLSGCDLRQEDAGFLHLMEQLLHLSKI